MARVCYLFLALSFFASSLSFAADYCPESFAFLHSSDIADRSPQLAEFLQSKAIARLLKTQPESFRELTDKIATLPLGKNSINLKTNDFKIWLEVNKTKNTLQLEIKYFGVIKKKNNSDPDSQLANFFSMKKEGKKAVELGARSKSLNMDFPRLLVALLQGVEKQVVANPNLKKIHLKGGLVVNEHLVEQLKKWNFTPSFAMLGKIFKGPLVGSGFVNTLVSGYFQASMKSINYSGFVSSPDFFYKKGFFILSGVKKIFAARGNIKGKNWTLEITLDPNK